MKPTNFIKNIKVKDILLIHSMDILCNHIDTPILETYQIYLNLMS